MTESVVDETLAKVRTALIEADVPHRLVTEFVDSIRTEVVGQKLTDALKPSEKLIKIVYDKLLAFLGGTESGVPTFHIPSTFIVMGLQGSGKTTTIAKIAQHLQDRARSRGKERRILCASVDFYRPAAIDQLEILAKRVGIDFYRAGSTQPVQATREIVAFAQRERYEHLFIDTAGRLHVDGTMLDELKGVVAAAKPTYKLLVLDAMTGQESLAVAQAFNEAVGFDGGVLSKVDSDTRGGAAFSFRYALTKPVWFVGTGEKPEDLEIFHPERMATRILGMGDLATLLERAESKITLSEQERMQTAMESGRMTLDDFAAQLGMMNRLGSMSQLVKYLPGMGNFKISDQMIEEGEREMRQFKAIMSSMTPRERQTPKILDRSRKERIARGSGTSVTSVNKLLERFEQTQQFAKLLKKNGRFPNMFR